MIDPEPVAARLSVTEWLVYPARGKDRANGASNQDIATELFVSRKTVEYHLHKVFSKLGIRTRQQPEYVLPGT